ncbi:MAG TPA: UvrB/UvrC motif-containing protein, partial [bacterium]|nr:UvrB/UvrC motif-containing protein [bacterium]
GNYDVLVGINLLREGLDLPEVSLVAILDADKEGFLRSETALIQTIGRAARHVEGMVVMYADTVTNSMRRAIDETDRRRAIQMRYNEEHGITPQSINKAIRDTLIQTEMPEVERTAIDTRGIEKMSRQDILTLIKELETNMQRAAQRLEFEEAAMLRDQIDAIKKTTGI